MKQIKPNAPETRSADLVQENLDRLKALFPEAFVEGKVDFEVLKQLLGGTVETGDEKYGLNWHGKRMARQIALTPSTGTLLPCPNDSAEWDTTQHLFIEGDNLEVLKLLQKSYAGQVKLIYIDPPYNTGKDFVYADDFHDNIRRYLETTGQLSGGTRTSSNSDASGRFHTAWLNMLYPRLKLARNLLRDDGLMMISIDAGAMPNLRHMCDEVFGPECFIMDLVWRKRDGAPNDRMIGSVHEYVLLYGTTLSSNSARTLAEDGLNLMPRTEKADAEYQVFSEPSGPDPRGRFRKIDTTANAKGGRDVASLHFGFVNPYTKETVFPRAGTCWRHSAAEMQRLQDDRRLYWGVDGTARTPMRKLFLSEAKPGMSTPSILPDMPLNQHAARELEVLFGEKSVFDTPKPLGLLKFLLRIGSDPSAIVMDFFAGSGTFGAAALQLNAEEGSNRRHISVQLPEPLDTSVGEHRIAIDFCTRLGKPANIAEITKERLRRSAAMLRKDNPMFSGDLGFRVFKLATSNMQAWDPTEKDVPGALFRNVDHIIPGRSEGDLLTELLLKLGLDLCVPTSKRIIADRNVYSVGSGTLIACLSDELPRQVIEPLAQGIAFWRAEIAPATESTVVFRDSAFADDVAKSNLVAILQQHGITNVRSL